MVKISAKFGAGRFQWNGGAWLGSLVGGTVYLGVGGAAFVSQDPVLATIWLACLAAALGIGYRIWTRRSTLDPYLGYQGLLLTCGLAGAVAIGAALVLAPQRLEAVQLTPSGGVFLLLLFPAMMAWFHFLEMMQRRAK